MANEVPDIPPDMRKVYLRLKRWRSSHARRVPLRDSLWVAAGELAREHGINRTAKVVLIHAYTSSFVSLPARLHIAQRFQDYGVVGNDRTPGVLEARHGAPEACRTVKAHLFNDFPEAGVRPFEGKK